MMSVSRSKKKAVRMRRTILPPRLCASPACPFGPEEGSPRVFTPTRSNHEFCSAGCASYERIKRWRAANKKKNEKEALADAAAQ
jgi:hypothetical protein